MVLQQVPVFKGAHHLPCHLVVLYAQLHLNSRSVSNYVWSLLRLLEDSLHPVLVGMSQFCSGNSEITNNQETINYTLWFMILILVVCVNQADEPCTNSSTFKYWSPYAVAWGSWFSSWSGNSRYNHSVCQLSQVWNWKFQCSISSAT